jgi:hypothetical protein
VLVNWGWSYFTLRPGIRLITGDDGKAAETASM